MPTPEPLTVELTQNDVSYLINGHGDDWTAHIHDGRKTTVSDGDSPLEALSSAASLHALETDPDDLDALVSAVIRLHWRVSVQRLASVA